MANRKQRSVSLKETNVNGFEAIEALLNQLADDVCPYLGHEKTMEQEFEGIRSVLDQMARRRRHQMVRVSGATRDLLIEADLIEADEDEEA